MLPFDDVIIRKWPSTCIDLIKGNISVSPTPGRSAKWNKSHVLILCTLLHRQNGHHFANIFTFICLLEQYCISVQIALKSLTKGLIKLNQIVFYTDSAPGRRQSIIWTKNGHVFFQCCLNPCQWNSTMKTSVEKISVILTNHLSQTQKENDKLHRWFHLFIYAFIYVFIYLFVYLFSLIKHSSCQCQRFQTPWPSCDITLMVINTIGFCIHKYDIMLLYIYYIYSIDSQQPWYVQTLFQLRGSTPVGSTGTVLILGKLHKNVI